MNCKLAWQVLSYWLHQPARRSGRAAAVLLLSTLVALDSQDIQVNDPSTTNQWHAAVAMDSDGDFVVAWESFVYGPKETSGNNVQIKLFHADGAPAGRQIEVEPLAISDRVPAVAMDGAGNFVVVWQNEAGPTENHTQTLSYGVLARRYRSDGSPIGEAFPVHDVDLSGSTYPAVAMNEGGDFVVVWQSNPGDENSPTRIQARLYDAQGRAQSDPLQVSSPGTDEGITPRFPAVAMDNAGDFVVVWERYGLTENPTGSVIQGQRFNQNGQAQGNELTINDRDSVQQRLPAVAMNDSGFFVVWHSLASAGNDTGSFSIQGKYFDSNGASQGSQFQINTETTGDQIYPVVSADDAGDFVVAWQSIVNSGDNSGYGVRALRYDRSIRPQGNEFQVNQDTTGDQRDPAIASDQNGDFVIAWQSSPAADGQYSITAGRFDQAGSPLNSAVEPGNTAASQSASVWLWTGFAGLAAVVAGITFYLYRRGEQAITRRGATQRMRMGRRRKKKGGTRPAITTRGQNRSGR